jgi:hypothetical protein
MVLAGARFQTSPGRSSGVTAKYRHSAREMTQIYTPALPRDK